MLNDSPAGSLRSRTRMRISFDSVNLIGFNTRVRGGSARKCLGTIRHDEGYDGAGASVEGVVRKSRMIFHTRRTSSVSVAP